MITNNEYLTVSQVATLAGITTQAVYKQLHNQLQPFVVKVGNKTMLKNSVIKEFYKKELPTELVIDATKVTNQNQPSCQPLPTNLDTVISVLNEQLIAKDQQIKDLSSKQDKLQNELNKQNEHTRQQSVKLISLVEQVNELQKNNQVLLAQSNQKQLTANNETTSDTPVVNKTSWWKRKKD